MIYDFKGKTPDIEKAALVADNASIVGDVTVGEDSTIWFNAVLRGDIAPVVVGKGTNIQEGCVLHVDPDTPCTVGDNVTIGHGAIIHGTKIGDRCLIGMGAIILSNSEIEEDSVIGAGALVKEGQIFPPRSIVVGAPAKKIRDITDADIERIGKVAKRYAEMGKELAKNPGKPNC